MSAIGRERKNSDIHDTLLKCHKLNKMSVKSTLLFDKGRNHLPNKQWPKGTC